MIIFQLKIHTLLVRELKVKCYLWEPFLLWNQ
jgi:hypothetical protein